MKKILPIIIVCGIASGLPVSLVSQTNNATLKPATDGCPSWSKKQPVTSKADYFAYLSHKPKAQDENNFYTPKYYNYNAASNTAAKKHTQASSEKYVGINQSKAPAAAPPIKKQTVIKPKEEPIIKEQAATPKAVTDNKAEEPAKEKGTTVSSSKKEEKQNETVKKSVKVKYQRKHWLKKGGFRKKRAADCPSF